MPTHIHSERGRRQVRFRSIQVRAAKARPKYRKAKVTSLARAMEASRMMIGMLARRWRTVLNDLLSKSWVLSILNLWVLSITPARSIRSSARVMALVPQPLWNMLKDGSSPEPNIKGSGNGPAPSIFQFL